MRQSVAGRVPHSSRVTSSTSPPAAPLPTAHASHRQAAATRHVAPCSGRRAHVVELRVPPIAATRRSSSSQVAVESPGEWQAACAAVFASATAPLHRKTCTQAERESNSWRMEAAQAALGAPSRRLFHEHDCASRRCVGQHWVLPTACALDRAPRSRTPVPGRRVKTHWQRASERRGELGTRCERKRAPSKRESDRLANGKASRASTRGRVHDHDGASRRYGRS